MANWTEQITDMAGTLANSESVSTHMDNAVIDVINKLSRINPSMLYMFADEVKNSGGSSNVVFTDNNLILRVSRRFDATDSRYRDCKEIMPSQVGDYSDSTSLYSASKEYPVFYREESAIKVLPAQLTAEYIIVDKVVYGTVTNITGDQNGAISNFPSGMYPMVVCHASMNTILEKMAETLPAGGLQELDLLEINGNAISDNTSPTNAELDDPKKYFARLRQFINADEDTELSAVQLEKIKAYLTWYSTSIEKNKTDYNWLMERLVVLKDRYEKMFLPYIQQKEDNDGRN